MNDIEAVRKIVEDLIEIMHVQAKQLEKLVVHVEQVTARLSNESQFSVVASELSELQVRIKKLVKSK